MKPCCNNRKLIALLSVGALNADQDRTLKAHLANCDDCRRYHEEILLTTKKLNRLEERTEIESSPGFHQRVLTALRKEERGPSWLNGRGIFWETILNWRTVFAAAAATSVVLLNCFVFLRHPAISPAERASNVSPARAAMREVDPTLSNYQTIANKSLEKLDDLMTQQGNRNLSSTPIYTASALAQVNALE